jgi:hypothetical protein
MFGNTNTKTVLMYLKKKKTEREVKKKSIKNVSKPDTETKMERIDKT